jgi:hypothetical protein
MKIEVTSEINNFVTDAPCNKDKCDICIKWVNFDKISIVGSVFICDDCSENIAENENIES